MKVPGRSLSPWHRVVIVGAFAACASAVTPARSWAQDVAAEQRPESISWSIDSPEQRGNGTAVQLTIEGLWGAHSTSSWSNDRSISELQGLSAGQLSGPTKPVRFAMIKEAGRLDCAGNAGRGRGKGVCGFTPDPGFATFLEARQIGRPNRRQSFSMTMSCVDRELVDALEKSRFERATVDQLTDMGIHGATPAYVRALGQLGYHLSARDLVDFLIHGVSPEEVREMATIGPALQRISPRGLIDLKIHGVEPSYIREMAAIDPSLRNVTAENLVSMAIHGVTPELARAYVQYEGGALGSDDLVSMAIHGVTPEYLQQLAALGYRDIAADDLVNMAIHGVTPDFVSQLNSAGMAHLSAQQLVRLRLSGFDPSER